jgi:hypothetical protein
VLVDCGFEVDPVWYQQNQRSDRSQSQGCEREWYVTAFGHTGICHCHGATSFGFLRMQDLTI